MKRLLIILVCLITSCGTIKSLYNENVYNEIHKENIKKRASSDLNCSTDKLVITPSEVSETGEYKVVTVEGCGKTGVYKLIPPETWVPGGNK